ncbi:MAG: ribonuclease P protein component [Alteromonadaceae bacterium]|nr:MAG: ribonuclease P protein component [Alteromonadaceae bacterium]
MAGETLSEVKLALTHPKSNRLLSSSDYSPIFDKAQIKVSHQRFLILARKTERSHPRLGIVVAKKNVKHAVKRNRLKRLIRDTFRTKQHKMPSIDAIVLARQGTESLSNQELIEILNNLWKRVVIKADRPK